VKYVLQYQGVDWLLIFHFMTDHKVPFSSSYNYNCMNISKFTYQAKQ